MQLADALAVALRGEGAQVKVDRREPGFTRLAVTVSDRRSVVVEAAQDARTAKRCSCRSGECSTPSPGSSPSPLSEARDHQQLVDCLAAVNNASNCRCVKPGSGDSAGTFGRRASSAGECSSTPSITHVRQKPATTDIRLATVDGRCRCTSCSQRT
jgi:hypothetical protein